MKNTKFLMLLFINFFSMAQKPPLAPSVKAVDTYHGIKVVDDFRNLENLNDSIVLNWMRVQSNYTQETLKNISNGKDFLKSMLELDKRNKFFYRDIKITRNKKYFYQKMKFDENYRKLYYREGFEGVEKLIYDPKDYKPESKINYVISYYKPSNDGTKVAIGITEGGKEIADIIIIDLISNTVLPEIITNTWPSDLGGIEWLNNDSGFIYTHIPNIDIKSDEFIKNTQAVVYKLGSDSKKIKDLFSKSNNPEIQINREDFPLINISSRFDNYIFGHIGGATNYSDYYYAKVEDIYNDKIVWKPFFSKEDKIKSFFIVGDEVVYISEKDNKSLICKTSMSNPDFINDNSLFNGISEEIIDDVSITKDGLFFTTIKNGVVAKLYFYKENNYKEIILPFVSGSVFMKSLDVDLSDFWVTCSGWTQPKKRYKYDLTTNTFLSEEFSESAQYPEYNNVVVEEIEIISHDGLKLPLTIIYNKGLKKNGKNKTIITGYGSYASSMQPFFSPYDLLWVLDGGILVKTHVRGGGEKGEPWHKGGLKETKPNTWKDFITSTEYLINEGFTSPKYIGIKGVSAGGILIGRAMTERPDLYKASIIDVGMLNAVRSEITPNGPNNVKEFGTVQNESEFKSLLEMDAFHNIQRGKKYPSTLVTAGINDPRVIAWEPTKFAAKLQAYQTGSNPIFLYVDMDGGHGGDVSFDKAYEKFANSYTFFYWQLGDPKYKLKKKRS